VVPEGGVELHTPGEQVRVGLLEFPPVFGGRVGLVDVVAHHDREGERIPLVIAVHHARHLALLGVTSAAVAENGEP
jgi:hypothetical protein